MSDLSQFISDLSVELFALHAHKVIQRVQDATLDGDGSGGADVVSSHHADCDPGSLAHPDGLWHLRKIEYKNLNVFSVSESCFEHISSTIFQMVKCACVRVNSPPQVSRGLQFPPQRCR